MDPDQQKLFESIRLLRQDRGVDLALLDSSFLWSERYLARRGSLPMGGGRLVLDQLDPIESLTLALGHAWLENCHERWHEREHHTCHRHVIERIKNDKFLSEPYWEQLLKSTHMFPRAVFLDRDVIRDWLGLATSFWTTDEEEEKKDEEAAKITMRQGIRFFRNYYAIAGLWWNADLPLSSKFLPSHSPIVNTVEKTIDQLIREGHASDTGVSDTLFGMACPMAAIERRNLKFPTHRVTPNVEQLVSEDMREGAMNARKQDPTVHWQDMAESTRDAWRLACLALKVEQGVKDADFSFYEKYSVRWHEWGSKATYEKLHRAARDTNPHPRICSIGTGWLVTGVFEKKRWTVISKRFAHAACVWIQAMAFMYKATLESGDRLNESFFKPIALQLPHINPRS